VAEKPSVNRLAIAAAIVGTAILAAVPLFVSGYRISSGITIFANIALATAWAFFSGPTRYISLATASFVGIGMYTVVIAGNYVPLSLALLLAALIGFGIALIIGLSTLRLSGVYFVIFTFGLTELLMQLATWYEISFSRRLTRFMPSSLSDLDSAVVYEILLFATVFTLAATWYVGRTRLGQALRAIGEDETVARHTGINTTLVKVFVFAFASAMMAFIGGVWALRLPYITPSIAFNPTWSFQVLIAALLGGPGFFWGPAVGAIPLVLLSDYFAGTFPYHFSIALGLCFVIIVYLIPGGIAPRLASWYHRLAATEAARQVRDRFAAWRHGLSLWQRTEMRPRLRGVRRKAPAMETTGGNPSSAAPLLRITDLRKAFGGLVAVRDLSFDIPKGSIIGLIGPNGSGKTTVLNLITGELVPDSGSILLEGEEMIGALSYQVNRARIARTFQLVRVLPGMTTRENVALGRMFGSDPVTASAATKEVNDLLARVGLVGHADQFGAQLTYIDQKRVELARALATHPQLLLLDEWLAGLNPTELKVGIELIRQIGKEGVTIVLVEHVMEAIRALCQHVVVMNAGEKIAEGTPAEVLSDQRVMQVYLGVDDAAA
jgi:branched-chain amino acid transport system permease protein